MSDANIKNGDTVYLHGKEFIVTRIIYEGEGFLKETYIDITHLYENHKGNLRSLQLFAISPFAVTKKRIN